MTKAGTEYMEIVGAVQQAMDPGAKVADRRVDSN